jgi:hypothetical protein
MRASRNIKLRELVKLLQLSVITSCKGVISPITNPNSENSHSTRGNIMFKNVLRPIFRNVHHILLKGMLHAMFKEIYLPHIQIYAPYNVEEYASYYVQEYAS